VNGKRRRNIIAKKMMRYYKKKENILTKNRRKTDNNQIKKGDLFIVFLIVFIPQFIVALQAYPMIYSSDELSALSIAASIAGYDWKPVVSEAGYYGIGYLWLFAPLFHIIKNPIWIYRIVLIVTAIVVSFSASFCYVILHKYFLVENRIRKIILSSFCGMLHLITARKVGISNGKVLYFLVWVIIYILCDLLNEIYNDKNYKKSEVYLLLALAYTLTIHTSAVCLLIGIWVFDIFYKLKKKRKILHNWFYIISIIEFIIIRIGLKIYQSGIWAKGTRNTSVIATVEGSLSQIGNFFKIEVYLNMLRIGLGQIYTANVVTRGVFLIACMVLIFFFTRVKNTDGYISECVFIIGGIFLFCTIFTIGGMSITWLGNVCRSMEKCEEGVFQDAYRAFTYVRYFGCYVSPFIMCAFVVAQEEHKILKRAAGIGMILMAALTVFFIKMILPYNRRSKSVQFMSLGSMSEYEKVSLDNWYSALFMALVIAFIGFILCFIKKEYIYLLLITALITYESFYLFLNSTSIGEQEIYHEADAGNILIQELSTETDLNEIYVYDYRNILNKMFYTYQFLNYEVTIIPELPKDTEADFLLFSNKKLEGELEGAYYWTRLDHNEYVYCSEKYFKYIKECKVDLYEYSGAVDTE